MTYPVPPLDARHASTGLATRVAALFAAKNSGSPDRFLACFSRNAMSYADATLGRRTIGWDAYRQTIERLMPGWGQGRSYPLRVVGNDRSAVVLVSDTPELFGDEIRALAAVDFNDAGYVTRWVDYWDSSSFDPAILQRLQSDDDDWPADFGPPTAAPDPRIEALCSRLHAVIGGGGGDPELFAYDAVWEDMALRLKLVGAKAIEAMLARASDALPFGHGALIRHVLGGSAGGGFEWRRDGDTRVNGLVAVEIDPDGRISRLTAVYDGGRLDRGHVRDLTQISIEAAAPHHRNGS